MANNKIEYLISLKDQFSKGIRSATGETNKLNSAVNKTKNSISNIGGGLKGMIAGIGIAALGKQILDVGSQFESAELGLKTLLGSADKAHDVFLQLKKDATTSPFGFETLLLGNKALISAGVNAQQAREDFNGLANAIAATGGGNDELQRMVVNLQSIKNVGKANAMDIKQFAVAGVNIYAVLAEYSKKYGVTLDQQNITYEQLTAALKNAGSEGGMYFNGLSNLANSTSGRLSNLGDSLKNSFYEVFQSLAPLINKVIVQITGLLELIPKFIAWIKQNFDQLKYVFQPVIDYVNYVKATFSELGKSFDWLGFVNRLFGAIAIILRVIMPIVKAVFFIAAKIGGMILNIIDGILWIVNKLGHLAGMKKIDLFKPTKNIVEETKGMGADLPAMPVMGAEGAAPSAGGGKKGKAGTSLDAVETRQATNFNIDIKNLIEELNINTNNLRESASAIKAEVTKAMIGAVNDFQLMAVK